MMFLNFNLKTKFASNKGFVLILKMHLYFFMIIFYFLHRAIGQKCLVYKCNQTQNPPKYFYSTL